MFPTTGPFLMSINYLVSKTQQVQSSFSQYDSSRMESRVLASAPLLSMIIAKPFHTFKSFESKEFTLCYHRFCSSLAAAPTLKPIFFKYLHNILRA